MSLYQCFSRTLRLRPALILAARVLPSTPPLFHNVERHCFERQLSRTEPPPRTRQTARDLAPSSIMQITSLLCDSDLSGSGGNNGNAVL